MNIYEGLHPVRRSQPGFWSLRTPAEIRRCLASGYHVYVAALLSAAALVFAIKDGKLNNLSFLSWTAGASSSEKLRLVPGLQNLGNNCFLNVILQALASCVFFQPFLQKLVEEFELHEGMGETLPLTVSLAALLEELNAISLERVVLSPRKVMLAMAYYTPNFGLTSQQDAAEAFLHLLSSLKEEISDYNHPHQCSLVDVFASHGKIITSRRSKGHIELERWQGHFLGPFDGILGSMLTCQSCSSQISLNFESCHSLPLSPVLMGDSTMVAGCTLLDCLKQFFAAEKVENYRCSYCWHNTGTQYMKFLQPDKVSWSNKFSCALKQLSIAHCPKILCIHLKRVSMNVFGDVLKLEGHISFPLILDLFPFMLTGVEIKDLEEQVGGQYTVSNRKPSHCSSDSTFAIDLESGICQIAPSETCLYRLVSVVEHFGRAGAGHYTVFRRVQDNPLEPDPDGSLQAVSPEWFHVSDSEVHLVSEEEVLAAEATLLFYEKI